MIGVLQERRRVSLLDFPLAHLLRLKRKKPVKSGQISTSFSWLKLSLLILVLHFQFCSPKLSSACSNLEVKDGFCYSQIHVIVAARSPCILQQTLTVSLRGSLPSRLISSPCFDTEMKGAEKGWC